MKTKRGGGYNPIKYTLTYYDGTTPIQPHTTPRLFDSETTYQNILYQLAKYNDSRILDTSRINLHVTHPGETKPITINMYNPGNKSDEFVRNGDKIVVTLRDEDRFYAKGKSQTRKGGKRKTKRKTRRRY